MTWSVGHVMLGVGNSSETFIAQTVTEADRRGWRAFVLGVNRAGPFDAVPPERVHCTEPVPPVRRALDRLTGRPWPERFASRAQPAARSWKLDLLHAHFGWAASCALPLADALDLPLVVTFYGSDASAPPPDRYRRVLERASKVIAVSDYVRERLRVLGPSAPVELIRNGVDLARLQPRRRVPNANKLLFVGRLVPVKGADVLLRAMPEILSRHSDARLELIGDGAERGALERLTTQLGIADAVTFRGAMNHDEVVDEIAAARALAVPSRTMPGGQAESSSMAFKEAMALGVPVVATASGGLTETCPPSLRPELAAPGDPAAFAAAATRLLSADDIERRARLGRAWVAEHYDAAVVSEQLIDCYAAMVEQ